MCVKLPPEDLNPDPYPPHPTSTYTCAFIFFFGSPYCIHFLYVLTNYQLIYMYSLSIYGFEQKSSPLY